ncbi:MAG: alkylhydroperoxidase family enzyme [Candidatus Aldehydirespiratoraceae bacterium]|jgi:alkylhydroperoxidase family enzyme
MTHVSPIPREELPALEETFQFIEAVTGFVPSSLRTMAHLPGLVEGFQALAVAVLGSPVIDAELKNLVSHVASRAAGCRYCQAHTGATAANQGTDPAKVAAVWEFETSELFSDAERVALRLAFHSGANAATDDDFAECRRHFTQEQIVAIVAVCSLFGYLNRWNDTMATELEEEPAAFAAETLSPLGWVVDKHA